MIRRPKPVPILDEVPELYPELDLTFPPEVTEAWRDARPYDDRSDEQ